MGRTRSVAVAVSLLVHVLIGAAVWIGSGFIRAAQPRSVAGAPLTSAPAPTRSRAGARPQIPKAFTPDDTALDPQAAMRGPGGKTVARAAVPAVGTAARVPHVERPAATTWEAFPIEEWTRKGESLAASVLNHLWQSTLFALAIAFATLAFRGNDARVRYWLWLAASIKFLVPFSLLIAFGRLISWPVPPQVLDSPGPVALTMMQIGVPFSRPAVASAPAIDPVASYRIAMALIVAWLAGIEFICVRRFRMWKQIRAAVRASRPFASSAAAMPANLSVRVTNTVLEPGVVGFVRPVLLLPSGIDMRLTSEEFDAIVEHENCHVRYRDNLAAAVHMLVEAVFWFHPLVWWIGGRLVQERERACDEHVLRAFRNPRAYADGIVNVCKEYIDAQLACVPGVSSSDLRRRIERIMKNETGEAMARWQKLALAISFAAVLIAPVAMGAASGPPASAQISSGPMGQPRDRAFTAASVKANMSGMLGSRLDPQAPGRLTAANVEAGILIRFAYDLPEFQLSGGPAWLSTDRFDIVASADGNPSIDEKRMMLRNLLAERFTLRTHTETRELPIYALTMARSDRRLGRALRSSTSDCAGVDGSPLLPGLAPSLSPDGPPKCGFFGFAPGTNFPSGRGGLAFRGLTMSAFAKTLVTMVHRHVSDETGLTGYFDGDFDFLAELPPPPPPPGIPNPWTTPFESVFTMLPDQMGLKLESRRGPVDVLVVDAISRPTEN
jgi:bla regulator protein BlaR1